MITRNAGRQLPVRFAALAVLGCIVVGLLVSPALAQAGSAPDKPRGLTAAASHDSVTLSWDDPGDDTITGYAILRRVRENDVGGEFSVFVADTGTAATTYTDDTVAAGTTYTYRIKAINEHGTSKRSRWYHINTPAAPAATFVEGNSPDGQGDPDGAAGHGTPGGASTRASVNEPSGDDCPTDTTTSCEVDVDGDPVRGEIDVPSETTRTYFTDPSNPASSNTETAILYDFDTDWFAVDLEAGKTYRIEMKGYTPAPFTVPTLRLPQINAIYGTDGTYLFNTWSRDELSWHHLFRVTFHARDGGTHYIAASGESFAAGTYELQVTDITPE